VTFSETVQIVKVSDLLGQEIEIDEVRLQNPARYGKCDLYIFKDKKGTKCGFFNNNLKTFEVRAGDKIVLEGGANKAGLPMYVLAKVNGVSSKPNDKLDDFQIDNSIEACNERNKLFRMLRDEVMEDPKAENYKLDIHELERMALKLYKERYKIPDGIRIIWTGELQRVR